MLCCLCFYIYLEYPVDNSYNIAITSKILSFYSLLFFSHFFSLGSTSDLGAVVGNYWSILMIPSSFPNNFKRERKLLDWKKKFGTGTYEIFFQWKFKKKFEKNNRSFCRPYLFNFSPKISKFEVPDFYSGICAEKSMWYFKQTKNI